MAGGFEASGVEFSVLRHGAPHLCLAMVPHQKAEGWWWFPISLSFVGAVSHGGSIFP
jgi:hypothetical protein